MISTLWNLINALAALQFSHVLERPATTQMDSDLSGSSTSSPLRHGWTCKPACKPGYKCILDRCVVDVKCPKATKFGDGPPPRSSSRCRAPRDPNGLAPAPLESWFTKELFHDLFPKANIGWGPHECWPYSYESFAIAARYFPEFGDASGNSTSGANRTEIPLNANASAAISLSANASIKYTKAQMARRDVAAFFAHAVQETGENDASLYDRFKDNRKHADACFYRGGFFNWFEGGPISSFLPPQSPGFKPEDGDRCTMGGLYCVASPELDFFFPCNKEKVAQDDREQYFKGCYLGRGAVQISYNFNYGLFQQWLKERRIDVDLLAEPNLVMTKMDPPLAVLASLWFYMTPQPPKPAMHDIVIGNWEPGEENRAAGYEGPIFGPTSLVINNECNGEDESTPGGPGESRRIKAFKWFSEYFGFPLEEEKLLSCKRMVRKFDQLHVRMSYQPDWSTTWKERPCDCAPASYGGMIPYFEPGHYPEHFLEHNRKNRIRCAQSVYANPKMYSMINDTNKCLNYPSSEILG